MNFEACCRCGGLKMRPPNTGPQAHPVCRKCDRTAPQGEWHTSDRNRGTWYDKPRPDKGTT